jgi:hypothetical protein
MMFYYIDSYRLGYWIDLSIGIVAAIIALCALAFKYPPKRAWTVRFLAIGIAVAAALPFAAVAGYHRSRLSVNFLVTDQYGMPMEHAVFKQEGKLNEDQYTNEKGLITVRSVFRDKLGGEFIAPENEHSMARVIVKPNPYGPETLLVGGAGAPLAVFGWDDMEHAGPVRQVSASEPIRVALNRPWAH